MASPESSSNVGHILTTWLRLGEGWLPKENQGVYIRRRETAGLVINSELVVPAKTPSRVKPHGVTWKGNEGDLNCSSFVTKGLVEAITSLFSI